MPIFPTDIIVVPFLLIVIFSIAGIVYAFRYKNLGLAWPFWGGLCLKLVGCGLFILIYLFYYGSGDTFNYYYNGNAIFKLTLENPKAGAKIYTSKSTGESYYNQFNYDRKFTSTYFTNGQNFYASKLTSIAIFFAFGSYLGASLIFCFYSFWGLWAFYRVVLDLFPNFNKQYLALPIFYLPSVFFWGSPLLKDTLIIGAVGFYTYALYNLILKRRKVFLSLLALLVSLGPLLNLKLYVFISLTPAIIIWFILSSINVIENKTLKKLARPGLFIFTGIVILSLIPIISSLSQKYAIDSILKEAENSARYLYNKSIANDGAAYDVGITEYTPAGLTKAIPRVLSIAIFQPFIWEVRNPVMLISSIEGGITLLITLYVLLRLGLVRYFRYSFSHPFLFTCLAFSLVFFFAVTISTSNYGTLVRYKLPALPFYGLALVIPLLLYNREKEDKKNELETLAP